MMRIVLTGGTGFIGRTLTNCLSHAGHSVVLLTRNPESAKNRTDACIQAELWDGKTAGPWQKHFEQTDAVINLAGESIVAKRWTPAQKERIVNSRIEATKAMVEAIAAARNKPSILINASAIGYYGNVEEDDVKESHPRGTGFLADTCERWEREADQARKFGVRVVLARIGVVLEKDGGALQRMMIPFRLFIGGHPGSGRQWFSWVHREDIVGAILFALEHSQLSGPVNLASPEPLRMKEFCRVLGQVMKRPSWAPVPAFVLRAGFGEMAEMLLTGQKVLPQKLMDAGYRFRYPHLREALESIIL
jgi:uncharacterized protein (TIGR01777 family)